MPLKPITYTLAYSSYIELYPLIAAFLSMLIAQTIKVLSNYLKSGSLNPRIFGTTGGMPSSHSAMVVALTTSVGLKEGWDSTYFSMCIVFSTIVLYDAAGVRRAVGVQAKILNKMLSEAMGNGTFRAERIKELLGHTPLEVVAGAFLGAGIAFTLFY